jgi:hypothetical protein
MIIDGLNSHFTRYQCDVSNFDAYVDGCARESYDCGSDGTLFLQFPQSKNWLI